MSSSEQPKSLTHEAASQPGGSSCDNQHTDVASPQALITLETAVAGGESAELWNNWAAMQYAEGKVQTAEEGYQRCLQLDPRHRQASVNLGMLLLATGRAEQAATHLRSLTLSSEEQAAIDKLKREWIQTEKMKNLEAAVEYLLIHSLNAHTSKATGDSSNQTLTALFMKLLIAVKPSFFLDIGANDACTARVIKKIQPACDVWAFEANPLVHQKYSPLLAGTGANFVNLAIAETTGPIKFYAPRTLSRAMVNGEIIERTAVEPTDTGKTSMYKRTENSTYREFTVEAIRLDDFVALRNIALTSRNIALWIDVEGAAFEVLSGASASLAAVSIIMIETENHEFWSGQKQCADIARLLIAAGFVPVDRDREYGDKQFNTVFLHHSFQALLYPDNYRLEQAGKGLSSRATASADRERDIARTYHKDGNHPAAIPAPSSDMQTQAHKVTATSKTVTDSDPDCSTWNNPPSDPNCSTWNNLYSSQPLSRLSRPAATQVPSASLPRPVREETATPKKTYPSIAAQAATQMPIFVPVFDNPTYARMMLRQLSRLALPNIYLVDNGSTYPPMLQFLEEAEHIATVIRNGHNAGPREIVLSAIESDCVPDIFCVTDPDLEFNALLPENFLAELASLTKTYKLGKAGFALRLDDANLMHRRKFTIIGKEWHVTEWEEQFWKEPMDSLPDGSPVFRAIIDTTFSVYNKRHFTPNSFYLAARVAGNYTCRHLPWYQHSDLSADEEQYYRKSQKYSLHLGGVADTRASGLVKGALDSTANR